MTNFNGTQIIVPARAIIHQREIEGIVFFIGTFILIFKPYCILGTAVPVVNFITKNLQHYINDPNLRYRFVGLLYCTVVKLL